MHAPRRRFLHALAAAPLAPALAPQAAPPPAPPAPAAPAPAPSPDPLADALLEAVKLRYGAHLEAADLPRVRKRLGEAREIGERLRKAAALGNGDEPVTVFEARPRPSRAGGRR